jgi:molecular chaperone GrpE
MTSAGLVLPICPDPASGIMIDLRRPASRPSATARWNMFGKKPKTMTEPTGAAAPWPATDQTANTPAQEEFLHASEAASEHAVRDSQPDQNEEVERLTNELATLNDKHLRLLAEFDNFRKRTAKERIDMLQFAGENALKNMLPVLDDMERAIQNNEKSDDIEMVKQGFVLIHAKLLSILGSQGVKPMSELKGQPLDVDRHEAITKAPAPSADLKGKVIDVLENGYTLHDKVIRYAKVIVGE